MAARTVVLSLVVLAALFSRMPHATAQDERFAGTWLIVSGEPAPWANGSAQLGADSQAFIGQRVMFLPDRVDAPHPLGCGDATYEIAMIPPEGLFQGTLESASATADAAALGISGEAPTLLVSCDTGVFDFHLSGAALLTALDNIVYTLEREP